MAPDPDLDGFLDHLRHERRLAVTTVNAYGRDCAALARLANAGSLRELRGSDLKRAAAQLHAGGLSPRSLARMLSSWRALYSWLLRRRAIASDPCAGLRSPRAPRRLPSVLSPEEAASLLSVEAAGDEGLANRALFELAYGSGLRVSELVGLDLHSIDAAAGEARVTGKGAKTRLVPVGKAALAALAAWLPTRAQLAHAEETALFVGSRGRRLSARDVQRRIKRQGIAAGLALDVHPHMLRHSFASHVLQSSGDLRAVQEMLGHASIASTQVYTHLDFQHLARVYDAAHPRAKRRAR